MQAMKLAVAATLCLVVFAAHAPDEIILDWSRHRAQRFDGSRWVPLPEKPSGQ
jgi:hypothetical protein